MSEQAHVLQRARERYGLDLDWSDLRRLNRLCEIGGGVLLRRMHEAEHWAIQYSGHLLVAVFKRQPGIVVTLMPQRTGLRPSLRYRRKRTRMFHVEQLENDLQSTDNSGK